MAAVNDEADDVPDPREFSRRGEARTRVVDTLRDTLLRRVMGRVNAAIRRAGDLDRWEVVLDESRLLPTVSSLDQATCAVIGALHYEDFPDDPSTPGKVKALLRPLEAVIYPYVRARLADKSDLYTVEVTTVRQRDGVDGDEGEPALWIQWERTVEPQ